MHTSHYIGVDCVLFVLSLPLRICGSTRTYHTYDICAYIYIYTHRVCVVFRFFLIVFLLPSIRSDFLQSKGCMRQRDQPRKWEGYRLLLSTFFPWPSLSLSPSLSVSLSLSLSPSRSLYS